MQTRLKILTPEKVIVDKPVDHVGLESVSGSLGVLPEHTPLAAMLKKSLVTYTAGGVQESVEIKGGFARILPNSVTVFTE